MITNKNNESGPCQACGGSGRVSIGRSDDIKVTAPCLSCSSNWPHIGKVLKGPSLESFLNVLEISCGLSKGTVLVALDRCVKANIESGNIKV